MSEWELHGPHKHPFAACFQFVSNEELIHHKAAIKAPNAFDVVYSPRICRVLFQTTADDVTIEYFLFDWKFVSKWAIAVDEQNENLRPIGSQ